MPEAFEFLSEDDKPKKTFGAHQARVFLQRFGLNSSAKDDITAPVCAAIMAASAHVTFVDKEIKGLQAERAQLQAELGTAKKELGEISQIMDTDPLTKIGNRRGFTNVLSRMIARRDRDKKAFPKAVLLFLDVNDFKETNSHFSHAGGDAALVHVAQTIQKKVRKGDYVARVGGDEFAVILYDVGREEAEEVGKMLLKAVLDNPLMLKPMGEDKKIIESARRENARISLTFGTHKLKRSDVPEEVMQSMSGSMLGYKKKAKAYAQEYMEAQARGTKKPKLEL